MSKERKCIVCSRDYLFCGHCTRAPKSQMWRNSYCCEDCREIFRTCSEYEAGNINVEDAYKKLIQHNVERKDIQMSVKNSIDEIFDKAAKVTEPKSEVVCKTDEIADTTEKPKRRPRRRKMTKSEE